MPKALIQPQDKEKPKKEKQNKSLLNKFCINQKSTATSKDDIADWKPSIWKCDSRPKKNVRIEMKNESN